MKLALLLSMAVALAAPVQGQSDPLRNLSERAKGVFVAMVGEAQQRGANPMDVNDLIVALVVEDQDPDAPILFHQAPLGTVFSEGEGRTSPREHKAFLSPKVAVEVLVKLNGILLRSNSLPHNTKMQISPSLERVLNAAQQLPAQQGQVQPLHLLAAALQEPCEGTKFLQAAGIIEEQVLQAIRAEQ